MLSFSLPETPGRPLRILCLGAHCDDIEIGCGGTILRLTEDRDVACTWVVFSSNEERKREAEDSARQFLAESREKDVSIRSFRDGFFPYVGGGIKEAFEELKKVPSPDVIFTHYRSDLHQDHRLICELTWNTFREHLILEYEIPKYDGDLGSPNVFVHLAESVCDRKIAYLLQYFGSQRNKSWFNRETFDALLRLRGMESRAPQRRAEAFYCRKAVL